MIERLQQINKDLLSNIERNDWKGYDPYDVMNSRYVAGRSNRKFLLFLTQLNRLSPVNLRPLLGISPLCNSKANGLLLSALLGMDDNLSGMANELVRWLIDNRSEQFREYSIGFNFDITLKHYTSRENEPSLIITLFVMYAFIRYYQKYGDKKLLDLIISFAELLDNRLPQRETEDTLWYSYNFHKINEIYNATAKIGKFYSLLHHIDPGDEITEKIVKILNYLRIKQRKDGSWAYGEEINYTDGFHTAFVLEAVWNMRKVTDNGSYVEMFEKGLDHYRRELFRENGQPLYFHPGYPPNDFRRHLIKTDIRDCAMGIVLFSKIGDIKMAERVLNWTINNMYNEREGYFYYYKNRLWRNKIRFIRWQAWMHYAISEYLPRA